MQRPHTHASNQSANLSFFCIFFKFPIFVSQLIPFKKILKSYRFLSKTTIASNSIYAKIKYGNQSGKCPFLCSVNRCQSQILFYHLPIRRRFLWCMTVYNLKIRVVSVIVNRYAYQPALFLSLLDNVVFRESKWWNAQPISPMHFMAHWLDKGGGSHFLATSPASLKVGKRMSLHKLGWYNMKFEHWSIY